MKTKAESGQAMIEAAIGMAFIVTVIGAVFGYLLLSWTYFLVDTASDTLTLCTIEKRNAGNCIRASRQQIARAAPWVHIDKIESRWSPTFSGYLKSVSLIQVRLRLEGPWPTTYVSRRQYCERRIKLASYSSAHCS